MTEYANDHDLVDETVTADPEAAATLSDDVKTLITNMIDADPSLAAVGISERLATLHEHEVSPRAVEAVLQTHPLVIHSTEQSVE
ncbi:hypothetical protein ETD86_40405 [Nonomuraea turkmeniaca]|uniref:Uncharacterized protein n=1 Tax=Nonomuraea turkmeniaca TaxID=103838 RepID=A0A5S4F2D3_9ACTN|nr:hypothetical protein [Nonomuraea turkmeniaca]TMR10239.1 hypothetical protein ETD86_40405 [Nonomuraea turkmeniaca]